MDPPMGGTFSNNDRSLLIYPSWLSRFPWSYAHVSTSLQVEPQTPMAFLRQISQKDV